MDLFNLTITEEQRVFLHAVLDDTRRLNDADESLRVELRDMFQHAESGDVANCFNL